ncbi:MAG: cobalamin biosynthesis protein [Alphaproteobacteria bacterium]|nr:cobalamin biosynthesis protein [Alphaproteobacteria bacterium]
MVGDQEVSGRLYGLGVGAERDAPAGELRALAKEALAEAGLDAGSVACVASIDLKSGEPAVLALARHLGVPARFFTAAMLEAETPRLANPSEVVFRKVGCHGVAEGAALAAVGAGGALVVPKRTSSRCTVAIARAPKPIVVTNLGRGQA